MKISKQIRHGDSCVWHGKKLVRASRRSKKSAGVWNNASNVVVIDLDDKTHRIKIPKGLRIQGEAEMAIYNAGFGL